MDFDSEKELDSTYSKIGGFTRSSNTEKNCTLDKRTLLANRHYVYNITISLEFSMSLLGSLRRQLLIFSVTVRIQLLGDL